LAILKDGRALLSLVDWERRAGPKSPSQWVDGRSAKEVARAWLGGNADILPTEVSSALAEHQAFGTVQSWSAEPEVRLRFDDVAGGTRISDIVVDVKDSRGSFLIAVEAKADEPFGETIAEALSAAAERFLENERSNGVTRIQQLAKAILGPRRDREPTLKDLRYQLLTACAGALCEAGRRGYTRALLLIHEFFTDKTFDDLHLRNAHDLNSFVTRLSHGDVTTISPGAICGPFLVPNAPTTSTKVALYVGKVSRDLRSIAG
jgi:hypothetical protein